MNNSKDSIANPHKCKTEYFDSDHQCRSCRIQLGHAQFGSVDIRSLVHSVLRAKALTTLAFSFSFGLVISLT